MASTAWSSAYNGYNLTAYYTSDTADLYTGVGAASGNNDSYIYRAALPFDLSTVPAGATITAVVLRLYVASKTATASGGTIFVVPSTQASMTSLATSDFGLLAGSTTYNDTQPTFASLTTGAYNEITLNAAAIAAMTPGGNFKLALRTSWDKTNTSPGTPPSGYYESRMIFNASEAASNKPELVINYTAPTGGALPNRRRIPRGLYAR